MKQILILALLIALAYTSCTLPKKSLTDESSGTVCTEPVEGCSVYNSIQVSRCHTCSSGFVGSDVQGYHQTCTCEDSSLTAVELDDNTWACIKTKIPKCELYNSSNKNECHTCETSYTGYGKLSANRYTGCCKDADSTVVADQYGAENKCVLTASLIPGCTKYRDNNDKCYECDTGFTGDHKHMNDHSVCNCDSGNKVTTANGSTVCAASTIANCAKYINTGSYDKCHTCEDNYTGYDGTANNWVGCCDDGTKVVRPDESNTAAKRCVPNIQTCLQYKDGSDNCHTCHGSSTGVGSANDHTACDCTTVTDVKKPNLNGVYQCVDPTTIPNCDVYNVDFTKCHTCADTYTGHNGTDNQWGGCCATGKFIRKKNGGLDNEFCLTAEIEDCKEYASTTECYTCNLGTGSGGSSNAWTDCDCASAAAKVDNEQGIKVCPIENCDVHTSWGLCKTCASDFTGYDGTEGLWKGCCANAKHIGNSESGTGDRCLDAKIHSCIKYGNGVPTCHTCQTGTTGVGSSPAISECTCAGTEVTTTGNGDICVTTVIENCKEYNATLDKCKVCEDGYQGYGNAADAWEGCCIDSKFFQFKEDGTTARCIDKIAGCQKYVDAQTDQCHTCFDDYTKSVSHTCSCAAGFKKDDNGDSRCITDIPFCQEYNNGSLDTCATCIPGSTGIESNKECCPNNKIKVDDNDSSSKERCADELVGCTVYNKDNLAQCITCDTANGFTLASNACNCDKVVRKDETGKWTCQDNVDHCKVVINGDTTCQECDSESTGLSASGSAPFDSCCPNHKIIEVPNGGTPAKVCVDPIANCKEYTASGKCYECHTGFTGTGGSANAFDTCECTGASKVASIDDNDKPICVDEIENCMVYNNAAANKCYSCTPGFSPFGGITNQYEGCCGLPKIVADGPTGSVNVCVTAIADCTKYVGGASANCHTCAANFPGSGSANDHPACQCATNTVKGTTGNECVAALIDNCEIYTAAGKCYQCESGYGGIGTALSFDSCCGGAKFKYPISPSGFECKTATIDNCKLYKTGEEKCHTCHTTFVGAPATAGTHDTCDCADPKLVKEFESQEPACVAAEIEGCLYWNSSHPTKCHTCKPGYTGTGTSANQHPACCQAPKIVGVDDASAKHCITAIPGCAVYNQSQTDKCHTCSGDFVGPAGETANQWTACACPDGFTHDKSQSENYRCIPAAIDSCDEYREDDLYTCYSCETGTDGWKPARIVQANTFHSCCDYTLKSGPNSESICSQEISGCKYYSPSSPGKCHTCYDTFAATGGTVNEYDSCACSKSVQQEHDNNDPVCVDEIAGCRKYMKADLAYCQQCMGGYTGIGVSGGYSSCCDNDKYSQDEDYNPICIPAVIENCENYSKSTPTNCHTCLHGFSGSGSSSCTCSGTIVTAGARKTCITANAIANCRTYTSDARFCNTCETGTIPVGATNFYTACTACTGDATLKTTPQGQICAETIENCNTYDFASGKCAICTATFNAVGSAGQYTACECTGDYSVYTNASGNKVCAKTIANCETYLDDLSNCQVCETGFQGVGLPAAFGECVCALPNLLKDSNGSKQVCVLPINNCEQYDSDSANNGQCTKCSSGNTISADKLGCETCSQNVKKDENGKDICISTVIADCMKYSSANNAFCHTCNPGYTATGASPLITACACSSGNTANGTTGQLLCYTEVSNCSVYSENDPSKCHTCMTGYNPVGTANEHTGCTCSSPSFEGIKADNTKICATAEITKCKHYSAIDACSACHDGYDKAANGSTCTCSGKTETTVGGLPVCATTIADCDTYASATTCATCASTHDKNSAGTTCTLKGDNPADPSSGSVLGFAFVFVLLAVLLI